MAKELSEKEILLRLISGGSLIVKNKQAWLFVSKKKGRIPIDGRIASSLINTNYVVKKENLFILDPVKSDPDKESEYQLDIPDVMRGLSKLTKEEQNVFIMHMWNATIPTPSSNFFGTFNDRVDFVLQLIRFEFHVWYKERNRYMSVLNDLLNED